MKLKSSDKKWLLLVLGGSSLVLCLMRFTPTESGDRASVTTDPQVAAAGRDRHFRPGKLRTTETQTDTSARVIKHQSADFTQGEQLNTLVNDGLQMGGDPTFVSALEPERLFGVYVSPEETTLEPFNTLTASYEATTPESSLLEWAFRTRSESGDWSDWRDISAEELNQPVLLGAAGVSWQYRLTFHAADGASSPRVRHVTVTTRHTAIQLGMNSSAPISHQTTPPREHN